MADFVYPEFLEGNSAEEIQQRMMNALPEDIDGMPGGFAWDFTMPSALEKAEMIQWNLVRTLMLMFPEWAWGTWLDLHGQQKGVARKPAGFATGSVTITGTEGTRLPQGFIVCTAATENTSSVLFSLNEEVIIPDTGTKTVGVTAVVAGTGSNVSAGSVVIMAQPVEGVTSITNSAAITGGTEIESDDDYRERIVEAYALADVSFIGNDTDLIRWAKEVTGVGDCIVMPAWDGPGTIKLALIDNNGTPCTPEKCTEVYNHIISPNNRQERLLQTGSGTLTVVPADTLPMAYVCTGIELDDTTDIATVTKKFKEALKEYYVEAKLDGEVRYVKVVALLAGIAGVEDFATLTINGGQANIALDVEDYPATTSVSITT